jgi:hypothetical protein
MQQLLVIRNYKKLKQINRVHIWPDSNTTGTGSNDGGTGMDGYK